MFRQTERTETIYMLILNRAYWFDTKACPTETMITDTVLLKLVALCLNSLPSNMSTELGYVYQKHCEPKYIIEPLPPMVSTIYFSQCFWETQPCSSPEDLG